jgi:hypothetical protein
MKEKEGVELKRETACELGRVGMVVLTKQPTCSLPFPRFNAVRCDHMRGVEVTGTTSRLAYAKFPGLFPCRRG